MTMKQTLLAAAISGLLASTAQASLVISEYVEGSSNNKAIELLNTGDAAVDLAAWELQILFNGSTTPGQTFNLEGSIAPGSNFVFAHSAADPAILAVADQTTGAGLFNGDDAVLLLNGGTVADSIGQVGTDPGSYWGSGDALTQDRTLRRRAGTVADTDAYDAYDPATVFDGFPRNSFDDLGTAGKDDDNSGQPPTTPDLTCGAPATRISDIQGESDTSPVAGQHVVVEAVVTAAFNTDDGLGGVFVEEESSDRDDNPATSEGLFVYAPTLNAEPGQRLRLAGEVTEYNGLTELTNLSGTESCGTAELPPAAQISLPWADATAPEAFESMRVQFGSPLVVNDNYDLGRYGSLTLGSGRHFIPTNVAEPGADAAVVAELNALDRIILDDASNRQNPPVVPYPTPQLSASQTVRAGDTVQDLVGILDYRFSEWRLQPTASPSFSQANARTTEPRLEDRGNLVVASFNVLNFFNGDGMGGGFPTARGADNSEELARQTVKLVSALTTLDADVIGLMEIENDGYGQNSAIAELAGALGSEWQWVDPDLAQLGNDDIAVGLLYRSDRVETVGNAATLSAAPFDDLNRQPLAQTFRLKDSDDGVTIAVNHFKSKGCGSAEGSNADQNDGQSCWNPVRTQAAQALATWLAGDATGTGEQDTLIIGDLNAYAQEDPIQALATAGFTDLLTTHVGEQAYSYVFYGQAGYLDHALANPTLTSKVVDATVWPINADEPRALDYNTEFKTPEQQASFYAPDAYRASDHDPVIVALKLDTRTPADRADLNGDGRVTGRDLPRLVLALIFGRATPPAYDIDGNGRVDHQDLSTLIRVLTGH
ncbi:ExeM/NucH family extracellular endonuclease [Marinobacter vinifirmus]|uniref:ExeM/NucH family extracellular endonuclease n=1 Tax=Marinobacter vinifirmus TaxID=355591 RepID=A0A558BIJ3_9GAMM|nr:ExeM/NucH family extracellular endonuclease [Marinobacter vinifirmus]TVT36311.1 MAG: ExeM/NucH family extracellular endonuclease [Marinobacter vinifirmus]